MRRYGGGVPLALAAALFAAPAASGQDLKCETYRLDNGMTVILHEDHSLPVACVNLWYYVGSKDEAPGRSGFAHLFEHLMFMGTRRVPGGDFDALMEAGGGWNNASTSQDRTNYFSFGPAGLLPTLLWLDADRLEDLGREMTQEKLDRQREVVRNERRQTGEMQPYGKADLKITELMFPSGHPYHIDVIGTHEDLQAATVQNVKDFFSAYYVPNNASLVVAGDFDPPRIRPLVERLFGTLPRGPEPAHRRAEPVRIREVRRATYYDQVQFGRLTVVYHSPRHFEAGDAEMDLAAAVLASGKSSRLYRRLVYEEKLATDVTAEQNSMMLGSLFKVQVTAREGVGLDRVEKAVDEVLGGLIAEGPSAEELERHKAAVEYGMVAGLQSLLRRADRLNQYNFFFGEPNSFKRDLERYRKAKPADIRDWARKVLTPDARLVMGVLPQPPAGTTSPRDDRPGPAGEAKFQPPAPNTFTLSNGIPVRHWRRPELPLVTVTLQVDGGACDDEPALAGCAALAVEMLDEGAGPLGALEYAQALEQLGARLSTQTEHESVTVGLSVLRKNFDAALGLYADAVLRPKFEEKEWERVRRLHLEALKKDEDRPQSVAGKVGLRALFGEGHPYGRPAEGTVESVAGLSAPAARSAYARLFTPARAGLFIAGDLAPEEARSALEKALGGWKGGDRRSREDRLAEKSRRSWGEAGKEPLRVVLVNKPGAVQTVIRFFTRGPKYASPDRVRLQMLNTILGGSFTSRLNQNLRERHGYTYGARSRFAMEPSTGYFSAGADVQTEHTGAALREFLSEFGRLRGGDVTAEETAKSRQTNRLELVRSFEGQEGLVSTACLLDRNGLPFATLGEDLAAMERVTHEELNRLARPAIPLEHGLVVLVGDKAAIAPQLAGLDLPPPVEVSPRGTPLPPATGPAE